MTKHHTICREWQSEEPAHPPERRLCAALLTQAIEDFIGQSKFSNDGSTPTACRHLADIARERAFLWLFVCEENESKLSAQFCAQTVEYDLARIRTWLRTVHAPMFKYVVRQQQRVLHVG